MFVLEFKVNPKPTQISAIEEAIRTTQFVRNKALRYWMDHRGVGKKELFRYNTLLRKEFKFVEDLNSHACQVGIERVVRAINRFFENCKKSKPGKKGYPRFKKRSRSVEYKISGWKLSENRKHIEFTDKKRIGRLKLIGSRDLNYFQPEQIKRVRILRRADGYYVQFIIALDPRDIVPAIEPSQKALGLDLEIKYFLAQSNGQTEPNPQFYRKSERQLNRANRKKSKKFRKGKPQTQNYIKARQRYARKHLRVSRQREEFAKRVALRLIQSNVWRAYVRAACRRQDLNVKGLVKNRRLSKSISDAGWSNFRRWLEYFGYKYSKVTVAVPPHNTSQNCSNCGKKVQKSLSTRTHICPDCGLIEDRDVNAALNILQLGLSTVGHTGTYRLGERFPLAALDRSCSVTEPQ
ncbi:MAG: transposase [Moorea sp. SIO3G5]|nr:transposase [Moorena sp. SIO3G5]